MIPEVGATCAFTFTSRFATLNGIYRIRAETTFEDALASGVDFVANLYIPAGLASSDFNVDYSSYTKDRIAVLESVADSTVVYYVPESVFLTVPDSTVKEYLSLNVVAQLGVFANVQVIYPLLDQMKDLIQSSLGVTNPLRIIANPQNKVYLTDAEYATLEATREALTQAIMPLSVQLKAEVDKNTYLAAKVAAYEAVITSGGLAVPTT